MGRTAAESHEIAPFNRLAFGLFLEHGISREESNFDSHYREI